MIPSPPPGPPSTPPSAQAASPSTSADAASPGPGGDPDGGPDVVFLAIVASNGVIGDGRTQPWHLREDLARFKALTRGHPMVMGRATYDAIGRALPGRESVVLTGNPSWSAEGVHVVHDPQEALRVASALPGGDEVMVIGGGQVYRSLFSVATRLELTEVDAPAAGDVTFPELDPDVWHEVSRDDRAAFAFVTYRRTPGHR